MHAYQTYASMLLENSVSETEVGMNAAVPIVSESEENVNTKLIRGDLSSK